jgi:hypothetical protein
MPVASRQSTRHTNAPGPGAGALHSRSPHDRIRTGKPTSRRQHSDPSSTGRTPRLRAAPASPAATATHGAAHGSRNRASGRSPPHPAPQSKGRRTGTSRATRRRRDIEAQRDRRTCDQRHRDSAERAMGVAKPVMGGGYVRSRKVYGVQHPGLKRNRSPSILPR